MWSKIKAILIHAFPLFVALHLVYILMEYFIKSNVVGFQPNRSILYLFISLAFGYWSVNRKEKLKQS